jgi:uncharacterized protein YbbC (DUF1343 family)
MMRSDVLTGLDVLRRDGFGALEGLKVGLLVNQASVDRDLAHAADLFADAKNVKLHALFGPQHGITGTTQDNMIEWEGSMDPRLGVPVHSLYGAHRKPTEQMLEGIEALVIDLPDVGARYYTFVWTAKLCLEACADRGIGVFVLDRPNPVGGDAIEGTVLDPRYSSFVGLSPIAMRHGMTMGELLSMIRTREVPGAALTVIPLEGWRRGSYFDETGLPWVMPSPNLPILDSAIVYPGFCLLEGTNLSEGRGTTRPFEIFGAPFIDPYRLVEELRKEDLPGVHFRPVCFEPTFQKHAGSICQGAQMHVTDRRAFRPVLTAVALLKTVMRLYPDHFRWKEPPYEYEAVLLPFDILAGTDRLRRQIEEDRSLEEIRQSWSGELSGFDAIRREFLLYDGEGP